MTDFNALSPKLALQLIVGEGQAVQQILHPVADMAEAKRLFAHIRKTPGFVTLAEDSESPVMFHVRHIILVRVVVLTESPAVVPAPKLARLQQ